ESEWGWRLPKASSRRTADGFGLKMRSPLAGLALFLQFRLATRVHRPNLPSNRMARSPLVRCDREMENRKRILVVDDEPEITLVLRSGLTKHGYDVRVANEGEAALELFQAWTPDLVVTDLSMPNMDGLKFCQRLRAQSTIPIIVLSVKSDEATKVEALDTGADDYVTKPFGIGELLARVRAALRRSPESAEDETVIRDGDFSVDLSTRTVQVAEKEVKLSPKEFDLLLYFLRHAGKVLT